MEERILCNHKDSELEVHVSAHIDAGQLNIVGQDFGSVAESIFGDDEYEYFYSLSKKDTEKLHELLKNDCNSDKELLDLVSDFFSGIDGCKKFRKYCEKNSLKYNFSSYC